MFEAGPGFAFGEAALLYNARTSLSGVGEMLHRVVESECWPLRKLDGGSTLGDHQSQRGRRWEHRNAWKNGRNSADTMRRQDSEVWCLERRAFRELVIRHAAWGELIVYLRCMFARDLVIPAQMKYSTKHRRN